MKLGEVAPERRAELIEQAKAGEKVSAKTEVKKAKRAVREAELGAKQSAMPDKKYGVIYADPPWRLEPYSRDTGMDRAADNYYPTMDVEAIMAQPCRWPAIASCSCGRPRQWCHRR